MGFVGAGEGSRAAKREAQPSIDRDLSGTAAQARGLGTTAFFCIPLLSARLPTAGGFAYGLRWMGVWVGCGGGEGDEPGVLAERATRATLLRVSAPVSTGS